jgi:uridine kinase
MTLLGSVEFLLLPIKFMSQEKGLRKTAYCIGIGGCSRSGKTTMSKKICQIVQENSTNKINSCTSVHQDHFTNPKEELDKIWNPEENCDVLDWEAPSSVSR